MENGYRRLSEFYGKECGDKAVLAVNNISYYPATMGDVRPLGVSHVNVDGKLSITRDERGFVGTLEIETITSESPDTERMRKISLLRSRFSGPISLKLGEVRNYHPRSRVSIYSENTSFTVDAWSIHCDLPAVDADVCQAAST